MAIIVLTNLGGETNEVNTWGMSKGIAKIIGFDCIVDTNYITNDGQKLKRAKLSTMKKLVGSYELSKSRSPRTISLKDGKLIYDNGTASFELIQLSDGNFIKLGVENEEILEVMSSDFKKLKWKGDKEMLIRVDK